MRRSLLAAAALALLVLLAGCSALTPGGGEVDRDALAEEATYDWNTSADVTITVADGYYHAVYRVENRSTVGLSAFERLSNRRPLEVSAVKFRHRNGTVVNASAIAAERNDTHTVLTLPADEGRFAYRVPLSGKELYVATAATGSYEVVLPARTDVRYPLIGRVSPDGYERTVVDGRVHLRWDDLTDDRLVVQFYLLRDLWIFGGMLALGVVAAALGLAYMWLQLRGIAARRQVVDLEERER